jgi:hypothetical protein
MDKKIEFLLYLLKSLKLQSPYQISHKKTDIQEVPVEAPGMSQASGPPRLPALAAAKLPTTGIWKSC